MIVNKKIVERKPYKHKIALFWLFPIVWLVEIIKQALRPPIYKNGIHAITAITGGGKTLMAHILTENFIKKGYTVISNSKFNNHVKVIDIKEYFKDGKQVKPITNCIVIFDEIMKEFNRRDNRKKEYNDSFIPFISWLATHRHDRVPKVYLLTQSFNQYDVQLTNLIHYVNIVTTRIRPDWYLWNRKKELFINTSRPNKIFYYNKRKSDIDKDDIQKYIQMSDRKVYNKSVKRGKQYYKKTPRYYEPVTLKHLITFDTFAFDNKFKAYDTKKAQK